MRIEQDHGFPKLTALINNRFPFLDILSPKIFDAFVELCLSEKLARNALAVGTFPTVIPIRLVKKIWGDDKPGVVQRNVPGLYSGECNPTEKNIIWIQKERVQDYEKGTNSGKDIEMILLHECVHWARFIGEKPGRTEDNKEAGNEFQLKAYGIVATDHGAVSCK